MTIRRIYTVSRLKPKATESNNFPISTKELAEGINNSGSMLAAAGNSYEQSIALLTAANTTVESAVPYSDIRVIGTTQIGELPKAG